MSKTPIFTTITAKVGRPITHSLNDSSLRLLIKSQHLEVEKNILRNSHKNKRIVGYKYLQPVQGSLFIFSGQIRRMEWLTVKIVVIIKEVVHRKQTENSKQSAAS